MTLQLPLFEVKSDWELPSLSRLPNVDDKKMIGIDVETRDPRLKEMGPGGIRRDGELIGVSVSVGDEWSIYLPIGHATGRNLDRSVVLSWLNNNVCGADKTLVGANILYDIEWLSTVGVEPKGKLIDVQVVDALIEEEANESFSLNSLCQRWLGRTKNEDLLNEAARNYGVDPKSGMWKLPPEYVGPYAEWDARAPLAILNCQLAKLCDMDLSRIFLLENELTPILWKMRQKGVRVDLEAASRLSLSLVKDEEALRLKLKRLAKQDVDVWSNQALARMCDELKISYPSTANGNPSFVKEFLEGHDHPALNLVRDVREINRLREVFVDTWVTKHAVGDRVHPQWKQLRSDEGGTRTGRMASSNPNMQQVPSRADIAGQIRALFIADEDTRWIKMDYSQQEPRILVHFASLLDLEGVGLIRAAYRQDPRTDFYTYVSQASGKSRRDAKGATLGRMYGMGARRYSQNQGMSVDAAKQILEDFDRSFPFVKALADKCGNLAQTRGFIRTIGKRRRNFNMYEPAYSDTFVAPLPLERAQGKWPNQQLRRYGTHKALNSLIQGSAADMTKRAIILLYQELGIVPTLQVHDEIDVCADQSLGKHIREICEHVYDMEVPIVADMSIGDHWK